MTTVLLALHYQNEVMHPGGVIKLGMTEAAHGAVAAAAGRLLAWARAHEIPVISVRIAFRPDYADVIQNCKIFRDVVANGAMAEGSWGAAFYEGLGPVEGELVVKHSRVNAFYGSPLEETLRVLEADRLIIAGVATNSVVETTVRHAADMGYEVVVVANACSAGVSRLHEASLDNMRYVATVMTLEALMQTSRPNTRP